MLWVNAVYGADAPKLWAKLAPKLVTVTKGWWDSYSMFLEGEADMVLSYSTSPAYHLITEGKDHYAAAAFDEGHYLQIEVAGHIKIFSAPGVGPAISRNTDREKCAIIVAHYKLDVSGRKRPAQYQMDLMG